MKTTSQVVISSGYELDLIKVALEHYGEFLKAVKLPESFLYVGQLADIHRDIQRLLAQINDATKQYIAPQEGAE